MSPRMKTGMLACGLAGWVSAAVAQENCNAIISAIAKIGDVQAALSCVQAQVAAEADRARQVAENNRKQLLQQLPNQFDLVTTKVRHVAFKETTNGSWREIPESADAHACFLSSVRLPAQGLCQVTYQGSQERWTYSVSDPVGAGFTCTATCVWMDIRRTPEGEQ